MNTTASSRSTTFTSTANSRWARTPPTTAACASRTWPCSTCWPATPEKTIDGFTPDQRFFLGCGADLVRERDVRKPCALLALVQRALRRASTASTAWCRTAGIRQGVRLQGGLAHGSQARLPRLVSWLRVSDLASVLSSVAWLCEARSRIATCSYSSRRLTVVASVPLRLQLLPLPASRLATISSSLPLLRLRYSEMSCC